MQDRLWKKANAGLSSKIGEKGEEGVFFRFPLSAPRPLLSVHGLVYQIKFIRKKRASTGLRAIAGTNIELI